MKDRHAEQLLQHRVDLLYSGAALTLGVSLAVALIYYFVHLQYHEGGHNLWLGAICAALFARAVLAIAFHAGLHRTTAPPATWLRRYRWATGITGALWGVAAVMLDDPGDKVLLIFDILVVAGIAAGALSVMAADIFAYRDYVLLSLAPAGLYLLTTGERLDLGIALLVGLLIAFLVISGRRMHASIVGSLALGYEKADLLEELKQEKRRIVTESGSMMHQLMASAPLAVWALDSAGRVTYVDDKRLRTDCGFELPGPGGILLDAFADYPRMVEATRQALSGARVDTELLLGGHSYEVRYAPLEDNDGIQTGTIGVAVDVSERKRYEEELVRKANFDELTGLPNRHQVNAHLRGAFERAIRAHKRIAVLFLDLDNFKAINDSMGHKAGDLVLQQAATRLTNTLRGSDMAARLSGDEFLVVAENLDTAAYAEAVAHKLIAAFQTPFLVDSREVFITTSIGISTYPGDGTGTGQLLQSADTAMYHAKARGKNTYGFFTAEMQIAAQRHLAIETELRRALERGELQLYYQPKVCLVDGLVHGAEALLRWENATLGSVAPDEFVPVAEFAGLMPDIGDWVLHAACREAAAWRGLVPQTIQVAINVSPQQFRGTDLIANVVQAMVDFALEPERVELEITESVLVSDQIETLRIMNSLRDMGITLALDDFGTGYSSLSYLKRFPLQVLKIDRSFVRDLGEGDNDASLVDAIIAMAQSLGMHIVAEGAETREQVDYLQERGVTWVQGYYYSRPLPAADFRAFLVARNGPPVASGDQSMLADKPSSSVG